MLADMDQARDLLSVLTSDYVQGSRKIITSRTSSMASYLMLQSEGERLAEIQTVNQRADNNIPLLQRTAAQTMIAHETNNKERRERYERLAATPSA